MSGEYKSLKELAEENYHNNSKIQEKYSSFEDFLSQLQLPDKLSCSLDHATATGKSYVMYGIACIMLAEGAVDQVLVLCPSNAIEAGLTEEFRSLSAGRTLKDLLPAPLDTISYLTGPADAKIANPRIINASNTIQKGDICIENIHATYINTKSAIEDSLAGKGERTLVLNDEAHHLMSPSESFWKLKWTTMSPMKIGLSSDLPGNILLASTSCRRSRRIILSSSPQGALTSFSRRSGTALTRTSYPSLRQSCRDNLKEIN